MTLELVDMVRDEVEHATQRNMAVPCLLQVLCALQFYATGTFQQTVGDTIKISQPSVCRIINRVSKAFARKLRYFVKYPTNNNELRLTRESFFEIGGFPNVSGAIDCTHVRITNPGGPEGQLYINRKYYHSINVQVTCDAQMRMTNIVARYPGSVHDSRIFNECELKRQFEAQDMGLLLGDPGYACLPYLMTPINNGMCVIIMILEQFQ